LEGISSNGTNSRALVQVGIPVVGHIGLTPQSVHQPGYRQQGKSGGGRENLAEAIALEQAGAFAVVLSISNAVLLRLRKASDSDDWHWCRTALMVRY